MARWLTAADTDALAYIWPDAPTEEPAILALYLAAAKAACVAYAPSRDTETIPDEWVLAQAMQARNIYNAGGAAGGPSSDPTAGGYGIATSYPLDWHVKQLLRPAQGMGAIL